MSLRNNSSLPFYEETPKNLCNGRIVEDDISGSLIEGLCWMVIAVTSATLNANALQSMQKKMKVRKVHRIYLNNVFLCNLLFGSAAYLSYMIIKFGSDRCWLRDISFVCVVIFTNVNQISMLCILVCQLKNYCRVSSLPATALKKTPYKVHAIAVLGSWVFSIGIVLHNMFEPQSKVNLIFVIFKITCISALTVHAIRFIKKGINLQSQSALEMNRNNDMVNSKTAMIIMTAFLVTTIVTWFPLLVVLALQKFEVLSRASLAPALMISIRIVFLGPLVDPIFYFWSRRTRGSSARTLKDGIQLPNKPQ